MLPLQGGGGHRFGKLFHKIPDFFKGMLPLQGEGEGEEEEEKSQSKVGTRWVRQ